MRYGRLFSALAVVAAANPLVALNELRARTDSPPGSSRTPSGRRTAPRTWRYLERNGFRGNWHTEDPGQARLQRGRPRRRGRRGALERAELWACAPTGRTGRTTSPSCWRRSSRSPATPTAASTPGPATSARSRPTLQTFTYPANGAHGTTSPYLYVLGYGGGTTSATLSGASLTGPDGRIRLRVVDNETEDVDGTLPPGGFLQPETPARERHAVHGAGHLHGRHGRAQGRALELHHGPCGRGTDALRRGRAGRHGACDGAARRTHAEGLARAVPHHQRRHPGPDHHPRAGDRAPRAGDRAAAGLQLPLDDAHADAHPDARAGSRRAAARCGSPSGSTGSGRARSRSRA